MSSQLTFMQPIIVPLLDRNLEQWLTPAWVAESLLLRDFSDLDSSDTVIDPGCGTGRWSRALSRLFPSTRVVGVEIDPILAEQAITSGCEVIVGDYATIPIDINPTTCIGNWPFNAQSFNSFLARTHQLLPDGGRCGVLTSIYNFQTTSRVLGYSEQWSVSTEILPRDMFPRLQDALVWALFRKDRLRRLWGLALYTETNAARSLKQRYRKVVDSEPSTWWSAVEAALRSLGGKASLTEIYVMTTKPTGNQWWKEKIRQVLQMHASSLGNGQWCLR